MTNNKKFDIYERALEFAARTAKFIERLPKGIAAIEYSRQLIRASGSIGANMEEADGALTRKDFINKMGISRRESRESRHWLRLIKATQVIKEQEAGKELDWLLGESKELLLIVSSIIRKTQENNLKFDIGD
ncbi:MAG: four helix bundle protein [Candidatus Omnitrophica bacterium]|nr:four helix bundle protein [Candidatus Omnitrophota bacterium]